MLQCPVCRSIYPPEDAFCPIDGSALVTAQYSAETPTVFFTVPSGPTQFLPQSPAKNASTGQFAIQPQHILIGVLSLIVFTLATVLFVTLWGSNGPKAENEFTKVETVTGAIVETNTPTDLSTNAPQNRTVQSYVASNSANVRLATGAAPRASPNGRWTGDWSSPSGAYLTLVVILDEDGTGRVTGRIEWTLRRTTRPEKMNKIGLSATEYVSGQFDAVTKTLSMKGFRKDDPHNVLVMLDSYRLNFSPGAGRLSGRAKNGGKWNASVNLAR